MAGASAAPSAAMAALKCDLSISPIDSYSPVAPHRSFLSIVHSIAAGGSVIKSQRPSYSFTSSFRGTTLRLNQGRSVRVPTAPFTTRAGGLVEKVSADKLNEYLMEERTVPIVIDFYATWCGPCVILAQELERLALEYQGEVKFLKVDTDEEFQLASQLEIRGLPTMVFVSPTESKKSQRTEGLLPSDTIREIIEDLIVKVEP